MAKCPGAAPWLAWVERYGATEITDITRELIDATKQSGIIMTDMMNPHVLSHLVWAFL